MKGLCMLSCLLAASAAAAGEAAPPELARAERYWAQKKYDEALKVLDAVIDKDFAAAKLAELLQADMLVILTAVENVSINFNKPDQKNLTNLTVAEAEKYIEENQFSPGSMLPKVQASISFLESNPKGKTLITSLEKAGEGLKGLAGTVIVRGE